MADKYDPHASIVTFDELMYPPPWSDNSRHMPNKITPKTTWEEVLGHELSNRAALEDGAEKTQPLSAAA